MRTALLALAMLLVGPLAATGCHEAGDSPELKPDLTDHLALSCEDNRPCEVGVCDLTTLACVDCIADSDCGAGRCHPRDHVCVQCTGDSDCDSSFCHPTQAVCVGCYDDAQCAGGVCHPDKLVCVECTSDRDCGSGTCNPATLACVGQCTTDSQCADRNPCTKELCESGTCVFTPRDATTSCDDGIACTTRDHCAAGTCIGEATSACCAPLECKPDALPVDTNNDGCNDTCACPPEPACPIGTTPHDQDGGGCNEQCLCASGAVIGPNGECPCAVGVTCDGGLVPSDLDGNGCPDTCTKPCTTDCDCASQGLEATTPCELTCTTCGTFLACVEGVCAGRCGVIPEGRCDCPAAPTCAAFETAFDSDDDGCNDACRCLVDGPNGCACPTTIQCGPSATPSDSDRDGCDDTCICNDPTRVQGADGNCCKDLGCPAGQVPIDVEGDSCPDTCVCENGATPGADPSFALPACPCKDLQCPEGSTATDSDPTDADTCPDICACANGTTPGPGGCDVCLTDCTDQELPAWLYFIDSDQDLCYDDTAECPIGETAAASPGAGCPDFCAPCKQLACPTGARAVDADGDRCPDECVCDDFAPAPESGCGCAFEVTCTPPEVPVDIDRDGCVDTCRTPCTTACDCDPTLLAAACDCAGCAVAATCVDGFCASSCGGSAAPCATPAADDEVCGCDGKTYASRCEATSAGVDVARAGICGGGCATDSDCNAGERCENALANCDSLAAPDTASCVLVPTSCLPAVDPVCGCDGKTYANDCERLRANVGQATRGACAN